MAAAVECRCACSLRRPHPPGCVPACPLLTSLCLCNAPVCRQTATPAAAQRGPGSRPSTGQRTAQCPRPSSQDTSQRVCRSPGAGCTRLRSSRGQLPRRPAAPTRCLMERPCPACPTPCRALCQPALHCAARPRRAAQRGGRRGAVRRLGGGRAGGPRGVPRCRRRGARQLCSHPGQRRVLAGRPVPGCAPLGCTWDRIHSLHASCDTVGSLAWCQQTDAAAGVGWWRRSSGDGWWAAGTCVMLTSPGPVLPSLPCRRGAERPLPAAGPQVFAARGQVGAQGVPQLQRRAGRAGLQPAADRPRQQLVVAVTRREGGPLRPIRRRPAADQHQLRPPACRPELPPLRIHVCRPLRVLCC